jgi:hypothetical protein
MSDVTDCPIVSDWQLMKEEFRSAIKEAAMAAATAAAAVVAANMLAEQVKLSVAETDKHVMAVLDKMEHLQQLDVIAKTLTSVSRALLGTLFFVVLILGVLSITLVVRGSPTTFTATAPGGGSVSVQGGEK